jgi:hypothetical protein
MKATTTFRLHTTVNSVTDEMARKAQGITEPLSHAKQRLENRRGPFLQQLHKKSRADEKIKLEPGEIGCKEGKWVPVVHVVDVTPLREIPEDQMFTGSGPRQPAPAPAPAAKRSSKQKRD